MKENKAGAPDPIHQAKTELTIIFGYLQLIENQIKNSGNDEVNKDSFSKAKQACTKLQKILEEL